MGVTIPRCHSGRRKRPLFALLGTAAEHKRHQTFETGHTLRIEDMALWVRISNPEHRSEHSACPLLRFNANIAAACACSGGLDVIDTESFRSGRAAKWVSTRRQPRRNRAFNRPGSRHVTILPTQAAPHERDQQPSDKEDGQDQQRDRGWA